MLDTILIVNATMIIGILFAEAIGRSYGIKSEAFMAQWMLIWGLVSLLPFSISALLALIGNEYATFVTGIGFVGFIGWFLGISSVASFSGAVQQQWIVRESALASYLQEGYVVVAVLDSGDVIVE